MPLGHVGIPVSDLKASTAFYASTIAPLGYRLCVEFEGKAAGFGPKRGVPDFWLGPENKTFDATSAPTHVAFQVSSKKIVHEFYEAAL
jgi:catechol 2,3-dioxygenase-like lactoylglutathione lyase family enzyme